MSSDQPTNGTGGHASANPAGPTSTPDAPIDPTSGKTVAEIFGEIVWLMTQDKSCVDIKLGDLERLVMPAILLRQFHLTYREPVNAVISAHNAKLSTSRNGAPALQPLAVQVYALVSDELLERIGGSVNGSFFPTITEWRCGTNKCVVLSASIAHHKLWDDKPEVTR